MIDVTTQYLVLVTATFLFTVLAILESEDVTKKIMLQLIASVGWFITGFMHFLAGDITSTFTVAPTYFFMGVGMIFALNLVYTVFQTFEEYWRRHGKIG